MKYNEFKLKKIKKYDFVELRIKNSKHKEKCLIVKITKNILHFVFVSEEPSITSFVPLIKVQYDYLEEIEKLDPSNLLFYAASNIKHIDDAILEWKNEGESNAKI